MVRYLMFLLVFLVQGINTFAFRFEINITDYKQQKVFLSQFNGNKLRILYEGETDNTGLVVLSDSKDLPEGLYVLSLNEKENIELLLNNDQNLQLFMDYPDLMNTVRCRGNNVLNKFFEYSKSFGDLITSENHVKQAIILNINERDTLPFLKNKLKEQRNITDAYLRTIILEEENILGAYVRGSALFRVNVFNEYSLEKLFDTLVPVKPYLQHFPYSTKFIDDFILNFREIPLKTIVNQTDSIISWAEEFPVLYQFVLTALYNGLNTENVPITEMLFYHVSVNYYLTEKVNWVGDKFKAQLEASISNLSNTIINAPFVNLARLTGDTDKFNYYGDNAELKIIVFIDSDCESCKDNLKQLHLRTKYDMANTSVYIYDMDEFLGTEKFNVLYPEWNIANVSAYNEQLIHKLKIQKVPAYFVLDNRNVLIHKGANIEEILKLNQPSDYL